MNSIVERLNAYQQVDSWGGPTIEALVRVLEDRVECSHELFLDILGDFVDADRPYQYGIINGFKRLWDTQDHKLPEIDWDRVWTALVGFFESIIVDAEFWAEEVIPDDPSILKSI